MISTLTQNVLMYPVLAAGALAFCSLGDAFLYVYLPANYQSIGLSAIWVGLILSVNRFARIFLNGLISYHVGTFGIRLMTLLATLAATLCTFTYGFAVSGFLWLLARILWGISFSTLRLSTLIYALQSNQKGITLGLSKGIVAIGPVVALLIGPLLIQGQSRIFVFSILALTGLCGFLLAFFLPALQLKPTKKLQLLPSFPSSLNKLVFLSAFVVEGMMVVQLAALISNGSLLSGEMLLLVAGYYLAYRRICLVLLSPIAGWLADKIGFEKVFVRTLFLLMIGLVLISVGFTIPGLLTAFTFSAMNASVSPGSAVSSSESMIKDLSDNATWRDLGAAGGTLIGAFLLDFLYLQIIYFIAFLLLGIGLILHLINSKKN